MIHVVLYEPEIPENTGNIMRTCAAAGAMLHIIEPIGWIWDDKRVKRSVMDYDQFMVLKRHNSWDDFAKEVQGEMFFLTRYGESVHSDFDYGAIAEDIYLVFGKESTGIPKPLLQKHFSHAFRIPMAPDARSMNLSNTVALVVYEVLRQKDYDGLSRVEVQKGEHFLRDYHES